MSLHSICIHWTHFVLLFFWIYSSTSFCWCSRLMAAELRAKNTDTRVKMTTWKPNYTHKSNCEFFRSVLFEIIAIAFVLYTKCQYQTELLQVAMQFAVDDELWFAWWWNVITNTMRIDVKKFAFFVRFFTCWKPFKHTFIVINVIGLYGYSRLITLSDILFVFVVAVVVAVDKFSFKNR